MSRDIEIVTDAQIATRAFDAAEVLDTPDAIQEYLAASFEEATETGDHRVILHAIGVIARARGMTDLARETGLARPALYRALSEDGNPEISTLLKVLSVFGIGLAPVAAPRSEPLPA